ncbi:MAG: hypothetical protein NWF09_08540 [Candidatus Bathyarchaeota archaeon]|nr:hypothetical protein [Candidatus Bathyarchaeota archaeon]
MSRARKEKTSITTEKDSVVYAVTAADSGNANNSRKKRKKEANEPLYLKRI